MSERQHRKRAKAGSGPPFTITLRWSCPGYKGGNMCSGSAWIAGQVANPKANPSAAADKLNFCMLYCPLRPDAGPEIEVVAVEAEGVESGAADG